MHTFKNGDIFIRNGVNGTLKLPNRDEISGEWEHRADGLYLKNGSAVLFDNGDKYIGGWRDGVPEGGGYMRYHGGANFTGAWHRGQVKGPGTLSFAGERIDGDWYPIFAPSRLDPSIRQYVGSYS